MTGISTLRQTAEQGMIVLIGYRPTVKQLKQVGVALAALAAAAALALIL